MSSAAASRAPEATHLVRFYTADDELVDAVALHVLHDTGSAAIIVATAPHRRLIEARLAEFGAQPGDTGEIVMLDADTVLHSFYDGERIDAMRFDELVGGLIRRRTSPLRPVRVYGEMVALLWDAGQVTAALELEQLWNGLAATASFSLLCGYPTHSTLAGSEAIGLMCDAHSVVVGRPSVRGHAEECRTFERSAGTPADGRQFVTSTLREWDVADRLDDIVLVANELVTNAVMHGQSDVSVTLTCDCGSIRVAVADRSAAEPRPANRGATAMSGRGLHIVDVLSSAWGHQRSSTGKVVWARFDRST